MNRINPSVMALVFIIIRHFVKYFTDNFYQVEKIELNKSQSDYVVTYFSKADKRYFITNGSAIINAPQIIEKFSPVDIAKIAELTTSLKYKNILNFSV